MKSFITTNAVAVALALTASVGQAQLILGDGFNADAYDPFGTGGILDLDQQTGQNGGDPFVDPGYTGAGSQNWVAGTANLQWDPGEAGNESLNAEAVAYDDDSTGKGRFLGIPANNPVTFRRGFRVMDSYTAADTYYMSALINPGGAFSNSGRREHALVGFTSAGWDESGFTNAGVVEGIPYGLAFGFAGEDAGAETDQLDLVVRARDTNVADPQLADTVLLSGTSEASLDNITYHVMLKLEVNVDGGSFDRVTYWVDPGDVSNEASATSSAAATGSFDTLAMDQNDRIDRTFVAMSSYEGKNLFFDEMRFAYDFESLRGVLPESGVDGDYNNDGVVDAADYTVWRDNLGQPLDLPNDITPGTVDDPGDYNVWAGNYGAVPAAPPAQTVPEPSAVLLAMLGAGACVRRRA